MADLWLPPLSLRESALLCESLDDRFFRVGSYEDPDAPSELSREIDGHVSAILEHNTESDLINAALQDPALMRGSTFRGPTPFDPEDDGARVAAWRQLELHLGRERQRLYAQAASDPSPDESALLHGSRAFRATGQARPSASQSE